MYGPKEIVREGRGTGLWHYTGSANGLVMAVGYCSPWEDCPDCHGAGASEMAGLDIPLLGSKDCATCGGDGVVERRPACPGHATPEEAVAHFRAYELDSARYSPEPPEGYGDTQHRCAECRAWTQGFAAAGLVAPRVVFLCPAHLTREFLEKHDAVMAVKYPVCPDPVGGAGAAPRGAEVGSHARV